MIKAIGKITPMLQMQADINNPEKILGTYDNF